MIISPAPVTVPVPASGPLGPRLSVPPSGPDDAEGGRRRNVKMTVSLHSILHLFKGKGVYRFSVDWWTCSHRRRHSRPMWSGVESRTWR